MKKILMGTSALALAGTIAGAGKAEAATWDLDWGGYFEAAVAYRDSDAFGTDGDGVDVLMDREIIFTPSIVLDNGLKFGVNVQLEGAINGADGEVDESYAFVEGSFGQLRLGEDDGVKDQMLGNAPDVSWVGASSGSLAGFLGLAGEQGTYGALDGDSAKIIYFSPRFSGFQVGVSYGHDNALDNGSQNSLTDTFSVAANYVNSFDAFDIALRAGYATSETVVGSASPDTWAVNAVLGYAGFKFGGSYAQNDSDGAGIFAADETSFYDIGVSYETGPWGVSFQHSNSSDDNSNAELTQYLGAVSYKLGPGVTAGAFAGYGESNFTGTDQDGFVVGTGFKLSF